VGRGRVPFPLCAALLPTWGEQAFAAARDQDRPLFLSVGYATCHWCHVMAHESFENGQIADLLNAHFVPVKVTPNAVAAANLVALGQLTGDVGRIERAEALIGSFLPRLEAFPSSHAGMLLALDGRLGAREEG